MSEGPYLLGVDVGGTHTDAVLLGKSGLAASCKVRTDHDNLIESVHASLETVLEHVGPGEVARLTLSTTLTTNAIVESKTEDVGVLVSAGPGLSPDSFVIGSAFAVVPGAIDHRGEELVPIDDKATARVAQEFADRGIKVFAAAGKFAVRNPAHESRIRRHLAMHADYVTLGHEISGQLNFPRRVAAAYYNSAVWRPYNAFVDVVEDSVRSFPQIAHDARVGVLKADGGTMPLGFSRRFPAESILSGPAASVMGIVALCDIREDSLILDIGGTTTDIAVFAGGAPVIDPEGATIGSYPTCIRALKTVSIGVGGDSAIATLGDSVRVGPRRLGPAMAQGGRTPTLVDALNALELCAFGDAARSIEGVMDFASARSYDWRKLCELAVKDALDKIRNAVRDMLTELNDKPVYTIHEIVAGRKVRPRRAHVMGGPAQAMAPLLKRALSLPASTPAYAEVANAIGAALTRNTMSLDLFADTARGVLSIPSLGVNKSAERGLTQTAAEQEARQALSQAMRKGGVAEAEITPQITASSSFNMVENGVTAGRNIRIRCQSMPGVLEDFAQGVRLSC